MSQLERRYALLRRMATLCVMLVLTITSISAFIRLSNDGLGCADWPQCYGAKLRQAQQGIATTAVDSPVIVTVRVLHRVAAVAVLILIMTMLFVCFAERPILWREGRIALALLALALFLALLGRWSSGARVPAVAIGNLLAGFALLALGWRLRQQVDERASPPVPEAGTAPLWTRLALTVLLIGIALGGLVSAAHAGLGCTAAVDCGGSWWPIQATLTAFNPWHEPLLVLGEVANPTTAAQHMAHRYGALAASLLLMAVGLHALAQGRRRVGMLLLSLTAVEMGLGLLLVAAGLPLSVALAHNVGAALLLAVVVSLV